MGQNLSFITGLHTKTGRDYLARVTSDDKAECAAVAKKYGKDYWDGDRKYGYGGYRYDGRWAKVAEHMVAHYKLPEDARILDVGCGKGYLLYELMRLLPKSQVAGVDVSEYAIAHSKEEVKPFLRQANARKLDFDAASFDFVYSITTLHNLHLFELDPALREIQRVSRGKSYVAVESYRTEREKMNLLYWQLTCAAFFNPEEWNWLFKQTGYKGDYEFIYFE